MTQGSIENSLVDMFTSQSYKHRTTKEDRGRGVPRKLKLVLNGATESERQRNIEVIVT